MAIAKQLQQALFTGFTTATITPAVGPKPVFLDQNLNASITPKPTQSIPLPLIGIGVVLALVLVAGVVEIKRG
jgi:hypothetical protein